MEAVPATVPQIGTLAEEAESATNKTKAQIGQKKVMLDKLGKFDGLLDTVKAAREALSDVRIATTIFWYPLTYRYIFTQLSGQQPQL
jgi:hypothetical protein